MMNPQNNQITIDKKSKILLFVLLILCIAVVLATHYRTIVLKDYERETSEPEAYQEFLQEQQGSS